MRRIAGIVLAAGGSTRLGEPKQLLVLHNETLVHAAVRAAKTGGCDTVCVVTGHAQAEVENVLADLNPIFVHNKEWQRGMGSSVRAGLNAVGPASAVVLLACDQPAVDGMVVRALIDLHDQSGKAVVASRYSETLGIPALFDHACFAELGALADERGAKAVIHADPARVVSFEFPDGALDLDSPGDLQAWRMKMHRAAEIHPV